MTDPSRPCPFCLSNDLDSYQSGDHCFIVCNSCRTFGPNGSTRDDAVARWDGASAWGVTTPDKEKPGL